MGHSSVRVTEQYYLQTSDANEIQACQVMEQEDSTILQALKFVYIMDDVIRFVSNSKYGGTAVVGINLTISCGD